MKNTLILFGLVLCFPALWGQSFTINGYVEEANSGEKLIGANIFNTINLEGTITNDYGYYSLTQKAGTVELRYSFVGYRTKTVRFQLNRDTTINVALEKDIVLDEVVITDSKIQDKVEETQMSITRMPMKLVKSLPVLMGEVDVIKAIQLLPGVQSGTEGGSGVYVRGGGPDENLVLLDGVPVYNVNHLFGFFSIFHGDAINSVKIIKGGFPARYGGRLSSVLDVRMKEGNMKEVHGEGSIGLIAAKFTIEGPVKKDTSSFIISARRTYIDILLQPFIMAISKANGGGRTNAGYYFYDLNAKFNYKFSGRSRLYVSGYFGRDKMYLYNKFDEDKLKSNLHWGNATFVSRYNYIINKKLFLNLRGSYSQYSNTFYNFFSSIYDSHSESFSFDQNSQIRDLALTLDFDYLPQPKHYIRFGVSETYHTFVPQVARFTMNVDDVDTTISRGFDNIYAHELNAYIEDDYKISKKLKINAGVHLSGFAVQQQFYKSAQARLSARYMISPKLSFKASYAQMSQYIHLLTSSHFSLPTDIWVPVTAQTKPMSSEQYAAGLFYNYDEDWIFSVEGYYKKMHNVIAFKEGANYFKLWEFQDWQEMLTSGEGWTYGVEFFAKKSFGKISGWLGYTLAWANRRFNGTDPLNFGEIFPYKYDRRHDIGIALQYRFNENVDMGGVWVFGSGYPATLYTQQMLYPNDETGDTYDYFVNYFDHTNNFRLPVYHRLDLGINFHKKTKWGERTWKLGTYNTYNRLNPTFMIPMRNWDTGKREIRQFSLFPIIPYIAYAFKF